MKLKEFFRRASAIWLLIGFVYFECGGRWQIFIASSVIAALLCIGAEDK